MAKNKNKQPKPTIETKTTVTVNKPQPSKGKRILKRLAIPKPFRYILKLMFAVMFVMMLIQGAVSMLSYVTQTGMINIASATDDATKSVLASQLNQHLNLTTYISALLIGATILWFIWKLAIVPLSHQYKKFLEWLNK